MATAYIVYTFLPLAMCFLLSGVNRLNNEKDKTILSILALLLFSLVIGLRYNVGVDYLAYLGRYEGRFLLDNRESVEPGYELLNTILRKLDIHYSLLFVSICILQIYPIFLGLKNDRKVLPVVVLMLFYTSYLFFMINGLRQAIAFSIIFYSLQFIQSRSFFRYLICIMLSASFHKSAIIFIPLYLFIHREWVSNKYYQLMILFISFFLGTSIQEHLWSSMPIFFNIIMRQEMNEMHVESLQELAWNEDGRGMAIYMWLIIDSIVIMSYNRLRAYASMQNPLFDIYYNLFFIGIVLSYIVGSTYLSRINVYFVNYRIFIYSYLSLFLYRQLKIHSRFYYFAAISFMWLSLLMFYYVAINKGAGLCAPYQFVFDLN